jgi:HK97 family phage prohead protease
MRRDFDELGIENIRAVLCGDMRTRVRENAEIEWRVPGEPGAADEYRVLTGYPAVFDQPTTLYEGKRYVLMEQIAPGAFDDVLDDDCHLNYVHESASAMARNGRSGPGGMELSVDAHGLRVYAKLPLDDWDVQRLAPKMDRGTVDQMSFAFYIESEDRHVYTDEEDREVNLYTITKVARLLDVCVAPLGAYSQTEAALRSIYEATLTGRADAGREASDSRSTEGVGGDEGRSTEGSRKQRLLLLEGESAINTFTERTLQ